MLRTRQKWPLSFCLSAAATAVVLAFLFQLPIEREVPGEPFLLFLLVVIASTLAFGASAGFLCTVLSTMLSTLFFEPVGSFALWHAVDLIKIELYAVVATCSVIAFARLGNMVIVARENAESLKRLNESKSILLRELAHSVANNFANVAALISVRSTTINDARARSVLDEAVEQIRIMDRCTRDCARVTAMCRWLAGTSLRICATNSKPPWRGGGRSHLNAKCTTCS